MAGQFIACSLVGAGLIEITKRSVKPPKVEKKFFRKDPFVYVQFIMPGQEDGLDDPMKFFPAI